MATKKSKLPPPLLPPEEVVAKAPPPKLTPAQRVGKYISDRTSRIPNPLRTPPINDDIVNDQLELGRIERGIKRLTRGALMVSVMGCVLAFSAPFYAPIYYYHTITPEGHTERIVPLNMPNLTNPAVVSWAAISVTEIMSFGFGDIEEKELAQKKRFTRDGWNAFVKAFMNAKIEDAFKKSQMVMTTAPTDVPVITEQGVNEDGIYQWKLSVPIVLTYAANDNVIHPETETIEITVLRVPYDTSPAGIAIDIWRQIRH